MAANGIDHLLTSGYSATAPTEKVLVLKKAGYHPAGGMPIVVYCHSANGTAVEPLGFSTPITAEGTTIDRLVRGVAAAGFMVVCADLGGKIWQNDTALGRVTEVVAWGRANGGRSGPLQFLGFSMGGGTALTWTRANLVEVASLCVFAPEVSLNDFVVNNRAGSATSVNAAYGGAYDDAVHGPTHSPVQFAGQITRPVDLWWSPDDLTCVASTQAVMLADLPSVTGHQISGDHGTSQQFDGMDIRTIVDSLVGHRP